METERCPFNGVDCEYIPLARKAEEQAKEIERLREAIKVQANAVQSLHDSETTEINRLRKIKREAHIATKTLDSERNANAILTDEIERLREQERKMTNHAIARMKETERLREALRTIAMSSLKNPEIKYGRNYCISVANAALQQKEKE